MRKCIRCNTEMIENLEIVVTNGYYGIGIKEKGFLKPLIGKVKCAVCKDCGYVETYIETKEKLMKITR